ncbi:MAG: response regulator transcription factor [Erysipelotrichaceae bacterium]|nr:response regulator transcription factor [Erysipelotrichaceae bacterium]
MAKILIVDDEINIGLLIKKYAEYEGHTCFIATDGKKALELFEKQRIDLIIVDVMMPIMDGYELVKEVRLFSKVAIIMLTAKGEEKDKLMGFDLGIDDYVVKPFSVGELMKRVSAILNRTNVNHKAYVQFGDLKIDYKAMMVTVAGTPINLSPKEYKLLTYLTQNKNIALTREQLIEEVWGYDYEKDERTLDTHIKLLRKNLGKYKDCIVTVRGVGYRFEANSNNEEN